MQKILILILLLALFAISLGLKANPTVQQFPPGQVVAGVVSRADPTTSYAIYLPSKYSESRKWPLLIAMDPRGRALIPMELFREAAEKLGYIVVSSYNTQSDAAWEPNVKAIKAILADIPNMFSIDDRRLYLSGFSGTAMGGWSFANNLRPHVAGLINFCGADFEWSKPVKGAGYSFFGASGFRDFNYEEMRRLDKNLDDLAIPHRILFFDGEHEWGPQSLCAEGLEWMELQAMKSGLRPRDAAWIDQSFQVRKTKAEALEKSGSPFEAYREYRSIESDFSRLEAIDGVSAKAKMFGETKVVKDTIHKMDRLGQDEKAYEKKVFAYLDEIYRPTDTMTEIERLKDLQISILQEKASKMDKPLEAQWAQRMLEILFVHTSFYVPREYLRSNDARRALKVIAIAEKIKPDSPRLLYMKAWACVVNKDDEGALKFLRNMAELKAIPSADALTTDPNFEPLKNNPAFKDLIEKLRLQPD